MTEERQQELKSLLVSNDFNLDSYKVLDMQEIIILNNTAKAFIEQNQDDENAQKFFKGKTKFLYGVVLEKLKILDEIFVIYSEATHMPYVTCDEVSFNDQAWIFTRENFAQNEVKRMEETKKPMQILKFTQEQFLPFYVNLYPLGINSVVIDRGVNMLEIQLDELCRRPDYSNLSKENIPITNPQLHLTSLYFMQELRRQVERSEKKDLKELEEEMLVNLSEGNFLVPVQFTGLKEGEEEPKAITTENKNIMVPFIKYENGDSYQPIFTDAAEFYKFNKEKKFRGIAIPFRNLSKIVVDQSMGVVLNPMGFNLILNKKQLEVKGE